METERLRARGGALGTISQLFFIADSSQVDKPMLVFIVLAVLLAACGQAELPPRQAAASLVLTTTTSVIANPKVAVGESATPIASETTCFQLHSPESGSEIARSSLLTFEWEEKLGAGSYQLQMELPNGYAEFHNSEVANLDKYLASLPLAGTYSWRVLAFDSAGKPICFSDSFTFSKAEYEADP